jgi:2-polyprenyl-3-methyl-5-hydroxy-6-metoxy-1,4-benzoquinol methylase
LRKPVHDHLNAWKGEYGKAIWRGPYDLAPIISHVPGGARVLDAGCGSGKMALPLARAGYRVTGLDLVREGLREIQGRGAIDLVTGDVRSLPFKEESFDAVVCYDVLQHLLEPERSRAAEEIKRVLVPGGRAFIEAFGRGDMRYGGKEVEPHTFRRETGIIYHYFSEDELKKLLSGFQEVTVKTTVTHKTFRGQGYERHRVFACGLKGQRNVLQPVVYK